MNEVDGQVTQAEQVERTEQVEGMVAVLLRVPRGTLDKVEALAARLRQERPGTRVSRADVMRLLLGIGLREAQREKID